MALHINLKHIQLPLFSSSSNVHYHKHSYCIQIFFSHNMPKTISAYSFLLYPLLKPVLPLTYSFLIFLLSIHSSTQRSHLRYIHSVLFSWPLPNTLNHHTVSLAIFFIKLLNYNITFNFIGMLLHMKYQILTFTLFNTFIPMFQILTKTFIFFI